MQKEWKQMFPLKSFKNKKRTLKMSSYIVRKIFEGKFTKYRKSFKAHPGNNIKKTFSVIFYKPFNNSMMYYIPNTPIILLQNASFKISMVRCNNILPKKISKTKLISNCSTMH